MRHACALPAVQHCVASSSPPPQPCSRVAAHTRARAFGLGTCSVPRRFVSAIGHRPVVSMGKREREGEEDRAAAPSSGHDKPRKEKNAKAKPKSAADAGQAPAAAPALAAAAAAEQAAELQPAAGSHDADAAAWPAQALQPRQEDGAAAAGGGGSGRRKGGKPAPVLPWMRVPIAIEASEGVLLEEVQGLDPRLKAALEGARRRGRASAGGRGAPPAHGPRRRAMAYRGAHWPARLVLASCPPPPPVPCRHRHRGAVPGADRGVAPDGGRRLCCARRLHLRTHRQRQDARLRAAGAAGAGGARGAAPTRPGRAAHPRLGLAGAEGGRGMAWGAACRQLPRVICVPCSALHPSLAHPPACRSPAPPRCSPCCRTCAPPWASPPALRQARPAWQQRRSCSRAAALVRCQHPMPRCACAAAAGCCQAGRLAGLQQRMLSRASHTHVFSLPLRRASHAPTSRHCGGHARPPHIAPGGHARLHSGPPAVPGG